MMLKESHFIARINLTSDRVEVVGDSTIGGAVSRELLIHNKVQLPNCNWGGCFVVVGG